MVTLLSGLWRQPLEGDAHDGEEYFSLMTDVKTAALWTSGPSNRSSSSSDIKLALFNRSRSVPTVSAQRPSVEDQQNELVGSRSAFLPLRRIPFSFWVFSDGVCKFCSRGATSSGSTKDCFVLTPPLFPQVQSLPSVMNQCDEQNDRRWLTDCFFFPLPFVFSGLFLPSSFLPLSHNLHFFLWCIGRIVSQHNIFIRAVSVSYRMAVPNTIYCPF